jgi:hypothetical protein
MTCEVRPRAVGIRNGAAGVRTRLGAAAASVAALAADVLFDPLHRHVPMCPFHAATGWWCPLCGGLRAADSLAHLDVRAALHQNLLFVSALPLVAAWWLTWLLRARKDRPRPAPPRVVVAASVVVAVVFTVVRNLPIAGGLRP